MKTFDFLYDSPKPIFQNQAELLLRRLGSSRLNRGKYIRHLLKLAELYLPMRFCFHHNPPFALIHADALSMIAKGLNYNDQEINIAAIHCLKCALEQKARIEAGKGDRLTTIKLQKDIRSQLELSLTSNKNLVRLASIKLLKAIPVDKRFDLNAHLNDVLWTIRWIAITLISRDDKTIDMSEFLLNCIPKHAKEKPPYEFVDAVAALGDYRRDELAEIYRYWKDRKR